MSTLSNAFFFKVLRPDLFKQGTSPALLSTAKLKFNFFITKRLHTYLAFIRVSPGVHMRLESHQLTTASIWNTPDVTQARCRLEKPQEVGGDSDAMGANSSWTSWESLSAWSKAMQHTRGDTDECTRWTSTGQRLRTPQLVQRLTESSNPKVRGFSAFLAIDQRWITAKKSHQLPWEYSI